MAQDPTNAGSKDRDDSTHQAPADDGDAVPVVNLSASQPDGICNDYDNYNGNNDDNNVNDNGNNDDNGNNCACETATATLHGVAGPDAQHLQQEPRDAGIPPPSREELEAERARADEYEQRLKLALADYQNLSRRTGQEIEAGTLKKTADVMTDIITIRDDLARARDASAKDGADASGLDSILRNMDSALARHGVTPIDALGEIFDPAMHEAVSTEVDGSFDEGTITREVRRGYTLKNTVIRPTMVVISKKE